MADGGSVLSGSGNPLADGGSVLSGSGNPLADGGSVPSGSGSPLADGGSVPSGSGGSVPSGSGGKASAPLYITSNLTLVDRPTLAETPIFGTIDIEESGKRPVSTLTTTLNGVQLSSGTDDSLALDNLPGSVNSTSISAAPGGNLSIVVSGGGKSASLTTPCPADVVITAPAEGATVTSGGSLEVTWTGSAGKQASALIKPAVYLRPYDPATNKIRSWPGLSPAGSYKALASTDNSATLTVPTETYAEYPGLLLTLAVVGTYVTSDQGEGVCQLSRQVHLVR